MTETRTIVATINRSTGQQNAIRADSTRREHNRNHRKKQRQKLCPSEEKYGYYQKAFRAQGAAAAGQGVEEQ